MKAIHLRTEHLKEALGLGTAAPRFYWNCEGGIAWQRKQFLQMRKLLAIRKSGTLKIRLPAVQSW